VTGTAATQVDRIVALVAELTRRELAGDGDPTWMELAGHFGVTPRQLQADVRTLTAITDDPDAEWLSSVRIIQEGENLSLWSGGPFRRPVRLTEPELAAIQVGLAAEADEPPALSRDLAALTAPGEWAVNAVDVSLAPGAGEAAVAALARRAVDERRVLRIKYAGASDRIGTDRSVEPHDVVYAEGRFYIAAWCREKGDWRNFRADRVLDALLEDAHFSVRPDVPPLRGPGGVFRVSEPPDAVQVRYGPRIARWLVERYPGAAREEDGSVVVVYQVADPAWLVRTVLQYGDEAEVVGPAEYREAMRGALTEAAARG
jgi:proteasome accessory factor C